MIESIDWEFLLIGATESPLWDVLVALGLMALAAGTSLWVVGCLRVVAIGHALAGIPLLVGGLAVSAGAVGVPVAWYFRTLPVDRFPLGVHVVVPDLIFLSENAGGWVPLGLALGLMGTALATIRRRPPRSDATRG